MYKTLTALFVLVLVTNPLSAQIIQPEVFRLWDLVIANVGWAVTTIFAVYFVFCVGYLFAKQQLRDSKTMKKNVAKASKRPVRNLNGMKYEATR